MIHASHAALSTPFGMISVFAEDGALVALEWGEAPDLNKHGAGPHDTLLRTACEQLDRYFAGELQDFALPLRPRGTPHQQRVWAQLARISYGATATYGEIAAALGTGPRAVARACASNPLPIIIPCHRVVGAAGSLGGYSGGDGIATKRALLLLENTGWAPSPPPAAASAGATPVAPLLEPAG